jgi:hypothetical protein
MAPRRKCVVVVGFALCGVLSVARAELRSFADPAVDGFAVSYCNSGGRDCGEAVAQSWCRVQGYEYASEWAIRRGVDFSSATIRLDDRGICRGAGCDAFQYITCGRDRGSDGHSYLMPKLGGAARATVISPDRRAAGAAVQTIEYRVLIPGCRPQATGELLCEDLHDYQHCRTLFKKGQVAGCRAGLAFDGNFAEPMRADAGSYSLQLDSSAEATVHRGRRGDGKLKGKAEFEVRFAAPAIDARDWCLEQDRYLYHPTGPQGGAATIDETDECGMPIGGSFEPHEDDLLQAYDLCELRGAWGDRVELPIELLVAALYHIGSARPDFVPTEESDRTKIVAPYVTLQAPMRVTCKD